ncbi:uncharacterized protein LOC133664680 isoform X2 [Entelurus aequoreus]|uniref:uncharacterized protein LOC133664680 isoform X2 n=1 Tax=Entelurus aequoreus TaxID=161455 RepID=UPI002B1E844A|nr:uncharacterized protein LOC133664680 isoform X2 [Entelurus aequoreus]
MKKFQQRAYKRRWAATTRHLKKQCRQSTLELESDDSEQDHDINSRNSDKVHGCCRDCFLHNEEHVFDADDEEEIRPKKKCRKEKTQIFVQAAPLPELPTFNFPISSEYQTTSASTSQYQTTPRHPGRPHSPARSSTSRLSPDRNASSSSQYQTTPASSSQYQTIPASSSQYQTTPASTSQYQTAPRSSRNALDSELFQLNMKVQNILENQGEIMRMLRGLAAQPVGPESVDVQDLIDQPFETLEQLRAFCERLDTDLLLRKQLVKALTALGGQNLADTVRTMLRKIATNKVLEQLGLRGKTGKVAFEDLPLYRIINSMQGCLQADDHS